MRRTLIVALAVLTLSLGVCLGSASAVRHAVGEADGLRRRAAEQARTGDLAAAGATLETLDEMWRRHARVLELIAAHDALSEVEGDIADAALCLQAGEALEFRRAATALGVALERIRIAEAVRWANLY